MHAEFAEGLDTSTCEVVEIAGVVADTGAKFATVVCPTTLGQSEDAAAVHGITVEELQSAPPFPIAFERFCAFLSASADDALEEVIDTSEGESQDMTPPDVPLPALCSPAPVVVLAAHNGMKFDGPVLVHQCIRYGLPICHLGRFKWLDTLEVAKAYGTSPCVKLQCLVRDAAADPGSAHRALDDAVALHAVMLRTAERRSVPLARLLKPFVVDFDVTTSLVDIAAGL